MQSEVEDLKIKLERLKCEIYRCILSYIVAEQLAHLFPTSALRNSFILMYAIALFEKATQFLL